jgi:type IV pilus assembly protein PilQ
LEDLESLRSETFQLNHQTAEAAKTLLSSQTPSLFSKRGSIVVDIHANLLLIRDIHSRMDKIRKFIQQIDQPHAPVP